MSSSRGRGWTSGIFAPAFSFPYLYAPYEVDGRFYYEGAAFTGLNLLRLAVDQRYLHIPYVDAVDGEAFRFILFDVLGSDVIHPARSLIDAYAQSIILPIVGNAEKEIAIFQEWVRTGRTDFIPPDEWELRAQGQPPGPNQTPNIEKPYLVNFYVPPEQQPYVLDWSRSNLERLFDIGYEFGSNLRSGESGYSSPLSASRELMPYAAFCAASRGAGSSAPHGVMPHDLGFRQPGRELPRKPMKINARKAPEAGAPPRFDPKAGRPKPSRRRRQSGPFR